MLLADDTPTVRVRSGELAVAFTFYSMSLCVERIHSHAAASCSTQLCQQPHSLRGYVATQARHFAARRGVVVRSERDVDNLINAAVAEPVSTPTSTSSSEFSIREDLVKTRYIAETLLPTRHGKFRLRGYKHSVSLQGLLPVLAVAPAILLTVVALCCSWMVALHSQNQRLSFAAKLKAKATWVETCSAALLFVGGDAASKQLMLLSLCRCHCVSMTLALHQVS